MKSLHLTFLFLIALLVELQGQTLQFFQDPNSKKYGVKDQDGKVITAPKYDDYRDFYNGNALVKSNERWDFLDERGNEMTGFKYEWINFFTKDNLAQYKVNGKIGFLNRSFEEVTPASFSSSTYFWDGLAAFTVKENGVYLSGYINSKFEVVVPPSYEIARDFINGFAMVKKNNLWTFIDKTGKEITPPKYEYVGLFNEGLAPVILGGKGGYINTQGQEVIPIQFDEIWDFKDGKAEVILAGRKYFIDKSGNDLSKALTSNVPQVQPTTTNPSLAELLQKAEQARQVKNLPEALKWYKLAAEAGDPYGMMMTGALYTGGNAMPENRPEAYRWTKMAAERGNAEAMFTLALMLEDGFGTDKNLQEALIWGQKAAATNLPKATDWVAQYQSRSDFQKGIAAFNAKNYPEALLWYKKAADQGDGAAMYNIGSMYANGQGVDINYLESHIWFEKSAEKGVTNAMLDLGNMYYEGYGVVKDLKEAYSWYKKAADGGNALAMSFISEMNWFGIGTEQDIKTGIDWLKKAAEAGHQPSQNILSQIEKGNQSGIQELNQGKAFLNQNDYSSAEPLLTKSADLGNPEAMELLGKVYFDQKSPFKDNYIAYYWIWSAIGMGREEALVLLNQFDRVDIFTVRLGLMSSNDVGTLQEIFIDQYLKESNYPKALYWAQRAANQGYDFGMFELGNIYYEGHGVTQDIPKAKEWFRRASEKGNDLASGMLKHLENQGK